MENVEVSMEKTKLQLCKILPIHQILSIPMGKSLHNSKAKFAMMIEVLLNYYWLAFVRAFLGLSEQQTVLN
jgi:hypothetical protein